jgi:hypothetical protein
MSLYDAGPSLQQEAATYAKYATAYAAAVASVNGADTPFARLYAYIMRARAEVTALDDGGVLDAVIQRLMMDVFIVGHAHAEPKLAACAREFDLVFNLLRTHAAHARQRQQAYAHILSTGAPTRGSAFCSSIRRAYHFSGCNAYHLWSLPSNDDDSYYTLRAYVCFLLGLYSVYTAATTSPVLTAAPSTIPTLAPVL